MRRRNQADTPALSRSHAAVKKTPPPPAAAPVRPRLTAASPDSSGRRFIVRPKTLFFDHDFDVQPGFPPSGRKSVDDFGRRDVSRATVADAGLCGAEARPVRGSLSRTRSGELATLAPGANDANEANGNGSPELAEVS